ncbi:unnamed protein product, partial [Gongylonema pulchrum]|uniref:G protein-coupled receptor n=1 Tax=Gongylonema pulchrum TaxID=637853 RepID=A0A183D349_9BILA
MLTKLIEVNYDIANSLSMIANMAVIVLLHCKKARKLLGPYRWIILIAAAIQFSSSFTTFLTPYRYHLFMSLAILLFCLLIVLEEFLYLRGVEITYDKNHYVLKRSTRKITIYEPFWTVMMFYFPQMISSLVTCFCTYSIHKELRKSATSERTKALQKQLTVAM